MFFAAILYRLIVDLKGLECSIIYINFQISLYYIFEVTTETQALFVLFLINYMASDFGQDIQTEDKTSDMESFFTAEHELSGKGLVLDESIDQPANSFDTDVNQDYEEYENYETADN